MKRILSLGFWVGLVYLIAFAQISGLQSFVNTSAVGVYLHVAMVCLAIVGFFAYVLRIIHYLFVQ